MAQDFTDDCFGAAHEAQVDMQNIEDNFTALKSTFSGASQPSNTVAGMWWYDTSSHILKIRNEANSAWLNVWNLASNKPVIANLANEITAAMLSSALKSPAAGTEGLRSLGTGSTQAAAGNDSRFGTVDNAGVSRAKLKTAQSSYISGTLGFEVFFVYIEGQDYSFAPNIYGQSANIQVYAHNAVDSGSTEIRFALKKDVSQDRNYGVRYRYVTATDRPFVYALQDTDGNIKHIWACEDPPPKYWGLGDKPKDFVPPLQLGDKDGKIIVPEEKEIIVFDYDMEEFNGLIDRMLRDGKLLHKMITDDFDFSKNQKKFVRKNIQL